MHIVTDPKLIERNAKIAKYTFFVSIGILGIGMYLSFQFPNDPQMLTWMMVILIVGFMLSQISIYFQNRWGRNPRPDEQITSSLKGMGDKYTLFHYTTPTSHLLIGPAGIWGLIPYSLNGTIVYEKNRWKQKGGSFFSKVIGGESIGRPDLEAAALQKDITRVLTAAFPDQEIPVVNVAFVFTHPQVKVQVEEPPILTVPVDKLKDYLKKSRKVRLMEPLEYEKFVDYFEEQAEKKKKK